MVYLVPYAVVELPEGDAFFPSEYLLRNLNIVAQLLNIAMSANSTLMENRMIHAFSRDIAAIDHTIVIPINKIAIRCRYAILIIKEKNSTFLKKLIADVRKAKCVTITANNSRLLLHNEFTICYSLFSSDSWRCGL